MTYAQVFRDRRGVTGSTVFADVEVNRERLDGLRQSFLHQYDGGVHAAGEQRAHAAHGDHRGRAAAGHESTVPRASGVSVSARGRVITRSNQVWATDITHIPMARGFLFLAAVMDWASRRVLSWRTSDTLSADFCIEAVEEAIARYGRPEIFDTDQGAQSTSAAFTGLLHDHGIAISMDGKGCWRDNIFVERLWRSIKYEEGYLHAYASVSEAWAGLTRYLTHYSRCHFRPRPNPAYPSS